jgi:hypothetical protein
VLTYFHPTNPTHRSVKKSGAYGNNQLTWMAEPSVTSTEGNFVILGSATVTSSQDFYDLDVTSSGAGDTCKFLEPCTGYNADPPTAQSAKTAVCPYSCEVAGGAAGAALAVTVTVVGTSGKGTADVQINQKGKEADACVLVKDTVFDQNTAHWGPKEICADQLSPIKVSYPAQCGCAATKAENTLYLVSEADGKTPVAESNTATVDIPACPGLAQPPQVVIDPNMALECKYDLKW